MVTHHPRKSTNVSAGHEPVSPSMGLQPTGVVNESITNNAGVEGRRWETLHPRSSVRLWRERTHDFMVLLCDGKF